MQWGRMYTAPFIDIEEWGPDAFNDTGSYSSQPGTKPLTEDAPPEALSPAIRSLHKARIVPALQSPHAERAYMYNRLRC